MAMGIVGITSYKDVVCRLMLMAAVALSLVSCDAGNDGVAGNGSHDGTEYADVPVTLNITAGYAGEGSVTRAPELSNDDDTDEENRINIEDEDYSILIFKETATAGGTADMVFAERFVPLAVTKVDNTKERLYTLQGMISVSAALKENPAAQDKYTIMILANWRSFGYEYDNLSLEKDVTTVGDVVEQARQKPYTLPAAPWQPYKNGRKGIPMCGVKEFTLTGSDIKSGTELEISTETDPIMMLRAVAKIEIIDNLYEGKRDADCGVKVASVSRYNKTGTLICDLKNNPSWYVEDHQVDTPTLPAVTPNQAADLEMLPAGTDDAGRPVWAAYVPEFDMSKLMTPGDVLRPAVKLQIRKPGSDPTLLGYIVDMADYGGGSTPVITNEYRYILRNHIYRFELTGSPDNPNRNIIINYTVCPWDERTAGDITFE